MPLNSIARVVQSWQPEKIERRDPYGWSKTFVILATLSLAVIFIEFADILVAQWSTLKARRGGTRVKCGWLLALQGTLTRKKSNRRSSTSNLSSRTVMRTMDHSRFMVRTLALGLASQAIACRRFETWWFVADFSSHKAQQSTGQACGIRIPLATFTHAKMQSRISRH